MPPKLNPKAKSIMALCADAREKYTPDGETTYCNLAVQFVVKNFSEYTGFRNTLANKMIQHMEESADWAEVEPNVAKLLADDGCIVIAGRRADPHGHVALCIGGRALVQSGKWGGKWPVVSNVGKRNWICGVNYAFSLPPKFYALIDDA